MVNSIIYSDLNQDSPTTAYRVEDVASIYQSIGNILSTPIGTRLFLPEFGSNLEYLLFEPMDDFTKAKIYNTIVEAIQRWEPRVKISYGSTSIESDPTNHKYTITIGFSIIGFSDQQFEYVGEAAREGC